MKPPPHSYGLETSQYLETVDKVSYMHLVRTAEECSEVSHAIMKILRFGLLNYDPRNFMDNRELLEEEIGNLQANIELLVKCRIVSQDEIDRNKNTKLEFLKDPNWKEPGVNGGKDD